MASPPWQDLTIDYLRFRLPEISEIEWLAALKCKKSNKCCKLYISETDQHLSDTDRVAEHLHFRKKQ